MVTYPLHKGADGWMSQKQFETFYWPSLKKVMDALIKEGLIQNMFAEGGYNTRLETVNEFAKGTVAWYFDKTEMAKAKKILGQQVRHPGKRAVYRCSSPARLRTRRNTAASSLRTAEKAEDISCRRAALQTIRGWRICVPCWLP